MFKSKSRERLIFSSRKKGKRRSKLSLLWVIVSLSLSLLVLELLARIFLDLSGNRGKFAQANDELDLINAYQLKFVNEQGDTYKTLETNGSLLAQRSLSVGYELVKEQDNSYWEINPQGFRDRDPVSTSKPKDEIRIFLLGGSTAFGYGSSSNETTIGEQLEVRLQQRLQQQKSSPQLYKPDVLPLDEAKRKKSLAKPSKIKPGKYRIINAAVPGYASGNELAQLALQILSYKPDLVIILDGYTDLMLSSREKAAQIPQLEAYLDDAMAHFWAYVNRSLQPLEKNSYLVKIIQSSLNNPQKSLEKTNFILSNKTENLAQYLPQDEAELQKRVDRYIQNHQKILSFCVGARIPLIVATQPEITGRNPSKLGATESEITTKLGRKYLQEVKNSYPRFIAANQKLAQTFPHNLKAVNLYNLNDKYPTPSFIDAIHLSEAANQKIAEQLYYAIAAFPKMQVVPVQPKPKPKPK